MSERTLYTWQQQARAAGPPAGPGRPRKHEEREKLRPLVRAELLQQGWSAGERPVHRALLARQDVREASLRLVRELVAQAKAEERARRERVERAERLHVRVLLRDAVWSGDATHTGRDARGGEAQALCVRELRSACTLDVSLGPPARAEDVLAQLDRCVAQRGGPPLVFQSDNGSPYTDARVARWMERHGVVHLFNLPHTPPHNAAVEHGHRELKAESGLGKGALLVDVPQRHTSVNELAPGPGTEGAEPSRGHVSLLEAGVRGTKRVVRECARRLLEAWERLDGARLRATRGWLTSRQHDAVGLPAASVVDRQAFLAEAHCAMRAARLASGSARARRLAERAACLEVMERHGLIERYRGGQRVPLPGCEGIS